MSQIEMILSRLDNPKSYGRDRWQAKCPAHDDSDPSLSVAVTGHGTVLLHCFAGCEPWAIVEAMGLSMTDLFPDGCREHIQPNWYMRQEKSSKDHARTVLTCAQGMRARGERLSKEDLRREREAFLTVKGER